ncbi:hypothetical protein BHU41_11465, partial [Lactobacillus crispatus]
MAGEQLIKMLTERGGSDSEYSDVIYGRVINVSPLRVQISNLIIIDDHFIVLRMHIGSFTMSGSLTTTEDKKGQDVEKPKTEKTTKPATFSLDNSLRVGDRVTMI